MEMLGKSHFYEGDEVQLNIREHFHYAQRGKLRRYSDELVDLIIPPYAFPFIINNSNHPLFADKCLKLITPAEGTPSWDARFTPAPPPEPMGEQNEKMNPDRILVEYDGKLTPIEELSEARYEHFLRTIYNVSLAYHSLKNHPATLDTQVEQIDTTIKPVENRQGSWKFKKPIDEYEPIRMGIRWAIGYMVGKYNLLEPTNIEVERIVANGLKSLRNGTIKVAPENKVSFEQRMEIAKAAMQGILASNPEYMLGDMSMPGVSEVVKLTIEYTDALIAELEKPEYSTNDEFPSTKN